MLELPGFGEAMYRPQNLTNMFFCFLVSYIIKQALQASISEHCNQKPLRNQARSVRPFGLMRWGAPPWVDPPASSVQSLLALYMEHKCVCVCVLVLYCEYIFYPHLRFTGALSSASCASRPPRNDPFRHTALPLTPLFWGTPVTVYGNSFPYTGIKPPYGGRPPYGGIPLI
jgi:hypothetical protein